MSINLIRRTFSTFPLLTAFHQRRIADKIAQVVNNRFNTSCEKHQEDLAKEVLPLVSKMSLSPKLELVLKFHPPANKSICHDVPHDYGVKLSLDDYRKDGTHFFLTETNQETILRHLRIPLNETEPL